MTTMLFPRSRSLGACCGSRSRSWSRIHVDSFGGGGSLFFVITRMGPRSRRVSLGTLFNIFVSRVWSLYHILSERA